MEFQILGPFEALAEGRRVSLRAAKPRALLAILLLHAGEPVSIDRLIADLWAGRPPATAAKILQTYVSQLRKALGDSTIVTGPAGYQLNVERDSLDAHRFERLLVEARGAEPAVASDRLREALAVWRGPALVDFAFEPWAQAEIGRLEELRLDALQDRLEADLALGRAAELVAELEALIAEYPLRERLRGQLMLALYRSGRQADALAAYRAARETLVEELGIEPGPALRRLERGILDQDPELDARTVDSLVGVTGRPTPSLAARSTSFVGREKELREIRALLGRADVRLLTLTGPAGTGKTRLAVEATTGDGRSRETVFVELAPIVDPGLVATTIASTLGLSETSTAAGDRGAHRPPARAAHAARPRQPRAGARCGTRARRAARRRARHATPRHEPSSPRPARGTHLLGAAASASGRVSSPSARPSPGDGGDTVVRRPCTRGAGRLRVLR